MVRLSVKNIPFIPANEMEKRKRKKRGGCKNRIFIRNDCIALKHPGMWGEARPGRDKMEETLISEYTAKVNRENRLKDPTTNNFGTP